MSEFFVDGSIGTDTGSGTVGDPYGQLNYGIRQETFDTANGTTIHIRDAGNAVLDERLDLTFADTSVTPAWVPAIDAPVIFRGYTSAAGDGGIGTIDGDATFPIFNNNATPDYIVFWDLRLTNCAANDIITLDDVITFINCEIDTTTAQGLDMGADIFVLGCYFHDIGINCLSTPGPGLVMGNVIDARGNSGHGLLQAANDMLFFRNCVIVNGAATGIQVGTDAYAIHNSIFGVTGTGVGLESRASVASDTIAFLNNVVAGFSGSGGIGIDALANAGNMLCIEAGNSAFNNETNYQASAQDWIAEGVEDLSVAPFNDPTNLDFAPIDTGSMSEGAVPSAFHSETHANNVLALWRGAIEPTESSPSGNQMALWRGAVQPAASVGSPPASVSVPPGPGHISRKPRIVEVDQPPPPQTMDEFTDEFFRENPNLAPPDKPQRRLRMTKEVREILSRYKE